MASSSSQSVPLSNATQKPSYAKATQIEYVPKREYAVVTDYVQGSERDDYFRALKTIVEPKRVMYLSRISNNRICFYLDSKQTVDALINADKSISVLNTVLRLRPLITKNKRVIVSNISPEIPDNIIENEMKKRNVTIRSTMTRLKAGASDPDFAHTLSHRRQFFISPEDFDKIPNSLQILHDDTNYWIYFSSDAIHCFICKKEGHIARDCREHMETEDPPAESQIEETISPENQTDSSTAPTVTSMQNLKIPDPKVSQIRTPIAPKRALTSTDSEANLSIDNESTKDTSLSDNDTGRSQIDQQISKIKKPKPKKVKKDDEHPQQKELNWDETNKRINDSSKQYPLNLTEIQNLFESTKGIQDVYDIAAHHTPKLKELAVMLEDIYDTLPSSGTKNHCTRLIKRIKEDSNSNLEEDSDSDNCFMPHDESN